ncbi:MAG: hypothetical protein ACI9SP_004092 [Arenicella sp.]
MSGHNIGNAPTFSTTSSGVSGRSATSAKVAWSPPGWGSDLAAGEAQRTPNLSAIVQSVVNRSDWSSNNSMALMIRKTSGNQTNRRAYASKNTTDASYYPVLVIVYSGGDSGPDDDNNGGGIGNQGGVKIAFIGDTSTSGNFQQVLNLIKSEGAELTIVAGDTSYGSQAPSTWNNMVVNTLGSNDPALVANGNHDYGDNDVSQIIGFGQQRLGGQSAVQCEGSYAEQMTCNYKGMYFVLSSIGSGGGSTSSHEAYINQQLQNAPDNQWRICVWHKNQKDMQVGNKGDEVGWNAYEICRDHGAMISTGHQHVYARTHLLSNMENQTIADTSSTMTLTDGRTISFVSGLGGVGIRSGEPYKNSAGQDYWGKWYTSTNGAKYGAMFGTFYESHADFYFKSIDNQVMDSFTVLKGYGTPATGTDGSNPSTDPDLIAPNDVAITSGTAEPVSLAWNDISVSEVQYLVQRRTSGSSWATIAELAPGSTNYSDTSVQSGASYGYRVGVKNASGEVFSTIVGVTVAGDDNSGGNQDTTKPTIQMTPPSIDLSIALNGQFIEPSVTCVDGVDGPRPVTTIGPVNTSQVGVYTPVYACSDEAGNVASTLNGDVKVTVYDEDTIDPVIVLDPPVLQIERLKGGTFVGPAVSCTDDQLNAPDLIKEGEVNADQVKLHTITYTCTDDAGNFDRKILEVNVVDELTDNPFTPANGRLFFQNIFRSPGQPSGSSLVNDGNRATTYTMTLEGVSVAPVWVGDLGQSYDMDDLRLIRPSGGSLYDLDNYSVFVSDIDLIPGGITEAELINNSNYSLVDDANFIQVQGELKGRWVYWLLRSSTDDSMGLAEIEAYLDTTKPNLTLMPSGDQEILRRQLFLNPSYSCTDEKGTTTVNISGEVNANKVGTYSLVYRCDDGFGNVDSQSVTIIVKPNSDDIQNSEDTDDDGHRDLEDNCPNHPNPNQSDSDDDGVGDVCDNIVIDQNVGACFLSPDETGPGKNGICPSSLNGEASLAQGNDGKLRSPNGRYTAEVYRGLLIIENLSGGQGQILHEIAPRSSAARTVKARLTNDGSFELLDNNDTALWSTGTYGSYADYLYISNDGNLYLECTDGSVVWRTNIHNETVAETVQACDTSVDVNTQKSIEMALKTRVAQNLLCQDDDDIAVFCPSGNRYQLLSVADSFISLSNDSDLTQDLEYGSWLGFLVDAWWTEDEVNLRCLDRNSGLNGCFVNKATIDENSLMTTWPSGAVYRDELPFDKDTNVEIPNLEIGDQRYILNTCHRHMTNQFYFDELSKVESFSSNTDNRQFIQRYFPKIDCLLDVRQEDAVAGGVVNYKDKTTAWLAAGVQVAQFVDEAAIFTAGAVALGGGVSILVAGTELELILLSATEIVETLGPVVNVGMAVHGIWTEFGELNSCITDVCKTRALTDMAINVVMLGVEAKGAADKLGKSRLAANAEGISKSAISLEAETGRAGGIWENVSLTSAQRNHFRIMTLVGLDPTLATIARAAGEANDFRYVNALLDLPESAFKDSKFVEGILEKADAVVKADGSIDSLALEEAIGSLQRDKEFFERLSGASCTISFP